MIIDRLPFSEYCLLYCPHGTTWLPLDGFSWNLRVFRKPAEKIQVSLKCDKNSGCFTRRALSFMTVLSWILFRMRYVSDKSCIESQNTHLRPNLFCFLIVPFMRCTAFPFHCYWDSGCETANIWASFLFCCGVGCICGSFFEVFMPYIA